MLPINAFDTDFKVGTKVKVYNPFGSYEYEDTVTSITPKGMYIKVGNINYRPKRNNYATHLSRWGIGSIRIITPT